ncbi:MAG: hypothetical protein KDD29_09695 [Flavobacteriales bacterium]|nr:hypothetical protein [Flavobacteriales bacterium]
MKKLLLPLILLSFMFSACKKDDEQPSTQCENCISFTDPNGIKREFKIYHKELFNNIGADLTDTAGNSYTNNGLRLYFSESPTSIIGVILSTIKPFDFKRNYTAGGSWHYIPPDYRGISGIYDRAIVIFWDGGNTQYFAHTANPSDVTVDYYSYSENVHDQHILKGKMSLVFESWNTIPSFGVKRAEISDAIINVKY